MKADAVIVGSGIVGMSLAITLSRQNKKVIIIEKNFSNNLNNNRFYALSEKTKIFFENINIWNNIKNTNIKSEGLVKGVIQITADGDPIIMLSDHGTIGGYPKIGVVISADYDKLVQIPPGSKIKFKEINLKDAETIFKLYEMETQNLISNIK